MEAAAAAAAAVARAESCREVNYSAPNDVAIIKTNERADAARIPFCCHVARAPSLFEAGALLMIVGLLESPHSWSHPPL